MQYVEGLKITSRVSAINALLHQFVDFEKNEAHIHPYLASDSIAKIVELLTQIYEIYEDEYDSMNDKFKHICEKIEKHRNDGYVDEMNTTKGTTDGCREMQEIMHQRVIDNYNKSWEKIKSYCK